MTHVPPLASPATSLWQRAAALAARAHQHQDRKDGCTPYVAHAFRVAMTVRTVFGCDDEEVIAAAMLHDVIEDTTIDYDDIAEQFTPRVAKLVATVSKDPRLPEHRREAMYDQRLAEASVEARLIKLADVYDNLSDCCSVERLHSYLPKVDRAIALAARDEELSEAVHIVRQLAERAREHLTPP